MKRKTSVRSHDRKGTKGVSSHTRKLADTLRKTVPGDVDDELIAIAEFRTREAQRLATDEINLEHKWMDLQARILTVMRGGMKVPKKLKDEQEEVFKELAKTEKKRMKTISLIRDSTKQLPLQKRRKLIRKQFTHRGITRFIS